jgi:serine protease
MKNKPFIICLGLVLSSWISLNAQTFYYSNNEQIFITENKTSAVFSYYSIPSIVNYDDANSIIDSIEYSADSLSVIVNFNTEWSSDLTSLISYLGINSSQIFGSSFSFVFSDGTKVFPSKNVVLKLQDGYELNDIQSLLSTNSLTYLRTDFDNIIASATDLVSSISSANAINNEEMIAWCHPDFLIKAIPATDPLYIAQYYLNNTGQSSGTVDVDIDASEAWNLTTGNGTVVIAVIDAGVAIHDDFDDDITGASKIILPGWGWDGLGGTPQYTAEKHGQRVAGIISAEHNIAKNIGIRGVCPRSFILPVRAPMLQFTNSTDYANAIQWSYQNGADIINCSWNLGAVTFSNITNAISDAQTLGRGGLGCPVIFSAGNTSSSTPSFPANVPNVIAVSALDKFGNMTS